MMNVDCTQNEHTIIHIQNNHMIDQYAKPLYRKQNQTSQHEHLSKTTIRNFSEITPLLKKCSHTTRKTNIVMGSQK